MSQFYGFDFGAACEHMPFAEVEEYFRFYDEWQKKAQEVSRGRSA